MRGKSLNQLSKFLSLVLRHHPEAAGIQLDTHGWADVRELLEGINASGRSIDMPTLELIVRTDNKGRYSFSKDKQRIRANQGHSIRVDVELKECIPPGTLFHGTAAKALPCILDEGLRPMGRLYVHLSKDTETATKVGARHGKPVVLEVDASQMVMDGYVFLLSENGVWLTERVPPQYLRVV